MAFDMFDRPVPGESLTKPLNSDPSTQPPKIDNLYDAFIQTTEAIENDEDLYTDLLNMIDSGVDIESLVHMVTFASFSKGQ